MIGVTYAAWQSCFNCQQPSNCVSVPASTPLQNVDVYYDQFTAFSNSTIAAALSKQYGVGCTFISGETNSYADANFASQQTVACNFSALTVNLRLVLDLDALGIASQLLSAPTLSVVGVGSNAWVPGSAEGILYVDVSNSGPVVVACQLAAGPCCLSAAAGSCAGSAVATSSMTEILMPNQTQRILSYVTVNQTSASGSCSFMLQANGTTVTYVSAEFEVVAASPPPPSPSPPPPPDSGITVTFQAVFSNLMYAQLEDPNFFLVFTSRLVLTSLLRAYRLCTLNTCSLWPAASELGLRRLRDCLMQVCTSRPFRLASRAINSAAVRQALS